MSGRMLCKLCNRKFKKYPQSSKFDRRCLTYKIPKSNVTVYDVLKTVYDYKVRVIRIIDMINQCNTCIQLKTKNIKAKLYLSLSPFILDLVLDQDGVLTPTPS